jgi:hypothetical protein
MGEGCCFSMNPSLRTLSFSTPGRYFGVFWDHDLSKMRRLEFSVDDQAEICVVNSDPAMDQAFSFDSLEGFRTVIKAIVAFHHASGSTGPSGHENK